MADGNDYNTESFSALSKNSTASIVESTKTLNFQDNLIESIKFSTTGEANNDLPEKNFKEDVCRDFLRGVCRRGSECKFSHPTEFPSNKNNHAPPTCRDFQNGVCIRKACKYAHISKHGDNSIEVNDPTVKRKRDVDTGYNYESNFLSYSDGFECQAQYNDKYSSYYCSSPAYSNRYSSPITGSFSNIIAECGDVETMAMRISYLQKQVVELRSVNELLIDQNSRLKTQLTIYQDISEIKDNKSNSKSCQTTPVIIQPYCQLLNNQWKLKSYSSTSKNHQSNNVQLTLRNNDYGTIKKR